MKKTLENAILLREKGDKIASKDLLIDLVSADPMNPVLLYQCAWTHDALGLEREAVSFYERAIENGLSGKDLAGALLGIGSTLRGLGEYQNSLKYLETGVKLFPENRALQVFLTMTLYNSNRSKEAVSTLLRLVAEQSSDSEITAFKKAILFYAQDLDQTWI